MEALIITDSKQNAIQWKQLWSLAALYGSIVIGWIAYYRYQPKLLEEFRFTDFTFFLVLAQGIILVVTPPLAGKIGDKYRFKKGHRIPIITAGISFAAMVFMAVAFTLITNPGEIFRWVLPILILFWLIAMSIFTSPALSTIELFAPVSKLPRAMAVLTIVANLIYSLEPVIVDIIDFLGAPITFATGGLVVFLSGYALKRNSLNLFKAQGNQPVQEENRHKKTNYLFILFLGIALGFATTILFNIFPGALERQFDSSDIDGNVLIVVILVLSAVVSLPLSSLVNHIGLIRSFWLSLTVILVSIAGVLFVPSTVVVIVMTVVFAVMFGALSVSSLPLAIQEAGFYEKVFCVGIFFSGVALPDGIVEVLLIF